MTDSFVNVVEKKGELESQKGKTKPNWKLFGIIGGLFGTALLVIYIVVGVRNGFFGRRKGVNVRVIDSKHQAEGEETDAAEVDRSSIRSVRAIHKLNSPGSIDVKDGPDGENADSNGFKSGLQQKPPGTKVVSPTKLTPHNTAPVDPITDARNQTEASEGRTSKTLADPSDANITPPIKTDDPRSQQNSSNVSVIDQNSPENKSEPDSSQSGFSLPKDFIEPPPGDLSDEIRNVIKNVEKPADFKNALNELRRKAQPPKTLRKIEAALYADNLVEKEMKKLVLESVMEGGDEKIKAALETYHRAVLQTKAAVELPSNGKDIKDVEMYGIVRKCLSEGTLSASDKTKLEDILSSPEETYTMKANSAQYLALKLKGCSEEEAAGTVKAYFKGSDQTKKDYEKFTLLAWAMMYFENFNENKEKTAKRYYSYALLKDSLPHELRDEHLYRTDAKELLLELIGGYPSSLLENVKSGEIPLIDTIRSAIASAGFPKDNFLFMAKFARQLMTFIRDVGYIKDQEEPSKHTREIKAVIDYCQHLIKKYVLLVRLKPKDPRVTNLKEWKAYKSDPFNLDIIRNLFNAVPKIGLDPDSVHQYVYENIQMQYYRTGCKILLESYQKLMVDYKF